MEVTIKFKRLTLKMYVGAYEKSSKKFYFFPAVGFFPYVFHYSFCRLRVTRIFYQTETAKEQEYFLVVGSRKKRI